MKATKLTWGVALFVGLLANGCGRRGSSTPPATALVAEDGRTADAPSTEPTSTKTPSDVQPGVPDVRALGTYKWERRQLSDMPADWQSRDGAQMVQLASGRILMIGGWSPYDPWGPLGGAGGDGGGDRLTNEVWKSDDRGASWQLLLAHNAAAPTSGPDARFPPSHAVGVVSYNGHAVVLGSDASTEAELVGDVWHESNNGATWTRVAMNAPTLGRGLFMCGNYKNAIYVMGGQASTQDPTTALNDVWRSTNGGVTWTQLANAPWSPRGMVYRPVEHDGKLYVVGGGRYADLPFVPVAFNGVFAFDGTTWQTILPDGHKQFTAAYYLPVASLDGRIWLFNGYEPDTNVELARAIASDDGGATWHSFPGGAGGAESHADSVLGIGDRILRVSGNLSERAVWEFVP